MSGEVDKLVDLDPSRHRLLLTSAYEVVQRGHKQVLYKLLKHKILIYTSERLLNACYKNGWRGITVRLALKFPHLDNILDPKLVIRLLKLDNDDLSRRMISRNLDYMGKHESVMIFLCSSGKANLVKNATKVGYVEPRHNNDIFLKAAKANQEILAILLDADPVKDMNSKRNTQNYLAIRQVI